MKTWMCICMIGWLLLAGCANKNPNMKKEEVIQSLLDQEEEIRRKKELTPEIPEGYIPPPGIRHTATIQTKEPVVTIDLPTALQNRKNLKLSDIADEVVYYRISFPEGEKAFGFDIIKTPRGNIGRTVYGLYLLKEGFQLDRLLLKNDAKVEGSSDFVMISQDASVLQCFYYEPGNELRCLIRETNASQAKKSNTWVGTVSLDLLFDSPEPLDISVVGNRVPAGKAHRIHRLKNGYATTGLFAIGMYTHDLKGDTLCYFNPDDEEAPNIQGTVRSGEGNDIYTYKEELYYRPAFNYHIYKIVDEKTICPVYKIGMGGKQATREQVMKLSSDISDRWLVDELLETDNNLFIRFTEGYGSPNNREAGKVAFYQVIYDKKMKALSSFINNDKPSYPAAIPNDLDGGMDFWPTFLIDGKPYMFKRGDLLKKELSKERLKNITALQDLTDNEMVLMTIK
ncbi:DUF4933 domain-containing protein [Parabacteroides sp. OttesenSCG-928-K15]|nr:DUF4933 domain-containing protein [Parabacteroides sp. OttesenSCG-928-K15]